ncbi:MAG TPA: efflux RND transporter periplasmic adaptor subunit [Anaerolineales bacterium]|nr:efflux RND transporter periplasmic adaptor subunit [Anaerolineales bacterium]
MQHKRPPLPAIILIVLIIATGIYYGVRALNTDGDGRLAASGTIESTVVNISPEMAGKVKDVLAGEGQSIKAGDALLSLDDSLLAAQRNVAQTGVDSARNGLLTAQGAYDMAQAQYDATMTAARAQQGAGRLADWMGRTPGQFDQPLWYFSRPEQLTAAQGEVDTSLQAVQKSQSDFDAVVKDLNNAAFVNAETRLSQARISYLNAKSVRDHAQATGGNVSPDSLDIHTPPFISSYQTKIEVAKRLSGDSDVLSAANDALDAAKAELEDAQNAYNALLSTTAADQVKEARAALSVAQERYQVSLDTLSRLQTGEYSPQVTIASAALEQAKAGLQHAQTAVQQAEANLALLDKQISKLTVYAPMDGVVLTRNVEPGEFVQPGATTFAMANLNNITITVYVPEDRYGQIKLGQPASVTVDSFPGETFTAEVIHIADQAEFTPRNVQTVEGRSATVYAIKLKVKDTEGKLKIGMPADVEFR